jgi:hypothetical protein
MSEAFRIERGWIYVDGTRQDDGSKGGQITWGHILKASVQRLAFWRR